MRLKSRKKYTLTQFDHRLYFFPLFDVRNRPVADDKGQRTNKTVQHGTRIDNGGRAALGFDHRFDDRCELFDIIDANFAISTQSFTVEASHFNFPISSATPM
jgi:hypothetical protein